MANWKQNFPFFNSNNKSLNKQQQLNSTEPKESQVSLQTAPRDNPFKQVQPVDIYIGGSEHSNSHLLYARFIYKFILDHLASNGTSANGTSKNASSSNGSSSNGTSINDTSFNSSSTMSNRNPFNTLLCQGMVHGLSYKCPVSGKYYREEELMVGPNGVKLIPMSEDKATETLGEPVVNSQSCPVPSQQQQQKATSEPSSQKPSTTGQQRVIVPRVAIESWEKMSKSRGNGVNPNDLLDAYGLDSVRMCILFKAPFSKVLDWSSRDIVGHRRWLNAMIQLYRSFAEAKTSLKSNSMQQVKRTSDHSSDVGRNHGIGQTSLVSDNVTESTASTMHNQRKNNSIPITDSSNQLSLDTNCMDQENSTIDSAMTAKNSSHQIESLLKASFNKCLETYIYAMTKNPPSFNVCISAMMKFSHTLQRPECFGVVPGVMEDYLLDFALLIYPFAPTVAHELHSILTSSKASRYLQSNSSDTDSYINSSDTSDIFDTASYSKCSIPDSYSCLWSIIRLCFWNA